MGTNWQLADNAFDRCTVGMTKAVSRRTSAGLLLAATIDSLLAAVGCGPNAPGSPPSGSAPSGGTKGADFSTCTLPAAKQNCVRIGGGPAPFYYEGWLCPDAACQSGWCSGTVLGQPGVCGATTQEIKDVVSSGEGKVLEGSLP